MVAKGGQHGGTAISATLTQDQARADRDASGPARAQASIAYAQVDVFEDLSEAADAWAGLQASGVCGPYQTLAWAEAWIATVGKARHLSPCIVVGRNAAGGPVAVLPFVVSRRGGLRVARFLGGRDSNANLGLFADPAAWDARSLRSLLTEAAIRARIGLYALQNQPELWDGAANPFLALPHQASANRGRMGLLAADPDATLRLRLSKHARKLLRQKAAKLERIGPLTHQIAASGSEAAAVIDAYLSQRRGRARSTGLAAPSTDQAEFLRRLAQTGSYGPAALELHALWCGSEIVATFGGTSQGGRFSGMILAIDDRQAIAQCSPGELLLKAVLEDLSRRGLASFDLGLGDARYKETFCDSPEPMFDSFLAIGVTGRIATAVLAFAARAKGSIKRSERARRALRWGRIAVERTRFSRP